MSGRTWSFARRTWETLPKGRTPAHPRLISSEEEEPFKPNSWDTLHGMDGVKECILKSFLKPILQREKLPEGSAPTGCLLYGPGGCGKTSLVMEMAARLKLGYLPISATALSTAVEIRASLTVSLSGSDGPTLALGV